MKRSLLGVFACLVLVSGCSGDPHADYLGVWQAPGNPPKTIEIAKDGDSYTFHDLSATGLDGKRKGPRILSKQGSQLTINNGISNLPMGLSGDKKNLLFADLSLTKVAKTDEQKVKQDIEIQHTQRVANNSNCEDLRREAKQKENEINRSSSAPGEQIKSMATMKSEMESRASKIPGCNGALLLY